MQNVGRRLLERTDRATDADWAAKCTAPAECASRNQRGLPSCYVSPAGARVQQLYDATRCTDAYGVEGHLIFRDVPAYHASMIYPCHQRYCREERR